MTLCTTTATGTTATGTTGTSGAGTVGSVGAGAGAGVGSPGVGGGASGTGSGGATTTGTGSTTGTIIGFVATSGSTGGETKPGSLTSASRSKPAPSSCNTPAFETGGPESPASALPSKAAVREASALDWAVCIFVVAAARLEAIALFAAAVPGPSAGTRKNPTADASSAVSAASSGSVLPSPAVLVGTFTVMPDCPSPPSEPAPCTVKLICWLPPSGV